MKGLLVKDFRLLIQRKRFFLLMALWAVVMGFTMDTAAFVVGWICMIMAIFSLSTLSYDEYDNSMPFLMSFPITPKEYAVEKYVFGAICGIVGWLFAVAVQIVPLLVKHASINVGSEIFSSLAVIPAIAIILSLCLPAELKWGAEKGRIYLIVIYGVVFAGVTFGSRVLSNNANLKSAISNVNISALILVGLLITVAITALSMLLSVKIMNKKEF